MYKRVKKKKADAAKKKKAAAKKKKKGGLARKSSVVSTGGSAAAKTLPTAKDRNMTVVVPKGDQIISVDSKKKPNPKTLNMSATMPPPTNNS